MDKEVLTVVQPDLCIICDPEKLDEQGCNGAPDLVIEILSKGNSKREMRIKYELYEESKVQEYWVFYPYEASVPQFVLGKDERYYLHARFSEDEMTTSPLFPDLEIDLGEIFV